MSMKKHLTITLCLLMTVGMLYAQGSENKVQKFKSAFQSEAFKLSGYGQAVYNLTEHPERSVSSETVNNTFSIARAFLFVTGKLGANNQFGYMLMYDFGPTSKLYEFYGEWLPKKSIGLRFGQYKVPFTIENPISLARIETINGSRLVAAMSGGTGDYNQYDANATVGKSGRDIGLQLYGTLFPEKDFYRIEYYTGLFNGSGFNVKDNNNHKNFLATVYAYPLKEFRFGGSIYSGKYPPYMAAANRLGSDTLTSFKWTLGAEYKGSKLYSRAEYIAAKDGNVKRNGYYGLLMYKFVPNQWEALVKYDYYNRNTQIKDNILTDLTVGVNYYFAPMSRIQLNYIYSDNKLDGCNNALVAQLQVYF